MITSFSLCLDTFATYIVHYKDNFPINNQFKKVTAKCNDTVYIGCKVPLHIIKIPLFYGKLEINIVFILYSLDLYLSGA